jgi:hypothetical protein
MNDGPVAAPLPAARLTRRADLSSIAFATTDELAPIDLPLGQERALDAVRFGIAPQQTGEGNGEEEWTSISPFDCDEVNVLVTHPANAPSAPVVEGLCPTPGNLVSRIEHDWHRGVMVTSRRRLRPGALHLSNVGYLLRDVRSVLLEPFGWRALRRAAVAAQCGDRAGRLQPRSRATGARCRADPAWNPRPLLLRRSKPALLCHAEPDRFCHPEPDRLCHSYPDRFCHSEPLQLSFRASPIVIPSRRRGISPHRCAGIPPPRYARPRDDIGWGSARTRDDRGRSARTRDDRG